MPLSEEQILSLAPDEASKKAGKDLANPSKWVSKGATEKALWGECKGSGAKPYQAQIDLTNIAFKCSCPSRKFPCKHGLGLLLYHARQTNDFTNTNMPGWVEDWLSKRTIKQEKQEEKKEKPVDEASRAKRQKAREQKVSDGTDELLVWIKDIVRNGILHIPEKGSDYFENMARRMVDAQAPGLAGMIRNLGNINFFKEGWQTVFMDQVIRLYMAVKGYKNLSSVNPLLQHDIRNRIGFTQNLDELKEKAGITDNWIVLGKQTTEEDNLTTERYWLYGINCCRYALVLQFIFRGQGAQLTITPGLFIQAELVFFDSASPMRALIKQQVNTNGVESVNGLSGWQQVAENETAVCSLQPFQTERPYIIKQLKPVQYNGRWWLMDAAQNMVLLKDSFTQLWKLISLSGGDALDMAVIGKENEYEPLGVWQNKEYKILN